MEEWVIADHVRPFIYEIILFLAIDLGGAEIRRVSPASFFLVIKNRLWGP